MEKHQWNDIKKEIDTMVTIDEKNMAKDINKTLSMIQNLISIYSKEVSLNIKLENEYKKTKQKKYNYYKTQYDITLSAKELEMYAEADDEVCDIRLKYKKNIQLLETINKYIDLLKNKQFQIKNYIDWRKFISGE